MRRIDQFGEKYLQDDGDGGLPDDLGMPNEEEQARFDSAYGPIEEKVIRACKEAGHKKVFVQYSAFESDESGGYPIDNLDEVATTLVDVKDGPIGALEKGEELTGQVVIYKPKSRFFGGANSVTYRSPILTSPTWLEIAIIANEAIRVTRDKSHIYLEGLRRAYPRKARSGIKYYKLLMGS